jgi:hypothetical protein
MVNKKTKLLKDAVVVSSIDIPHYNKNQIINFKCNNCKKDVNIKYSSFIKKTFLLCKDCQSKINSDYVNRGIKISEAKKKNPISHEKAVAAQTSRSADAKKATIEKFKKTMSTKDKSEMKLKMRAAKTNMTAEQKQKRIELFQESYYKSQREKIIKHATIVLDSKNIKYTENNFLFNCICPVCGTEWTWSPLKKSKYFTIHPYCPSCFKNNRSSFELKLCELLDSLNIKYISNDRKILDGKELDVYIPKAKLAIEFDGVYWHNNSLKSFEKYKALKEKDIQLINIFETEYNESKIRSILEGRLHLSKIYYARKCSIEEIDNETYKSFCNENHIQNYAAAKVKIGLFHNEELIQIMSFGKPRFNKKYEWEIVRECSKNCGVVGGKEKLFQYFLKMYNPISIISYCDNRYFTGSSYLRFGMIKEKDTKNGYIYTNGKITYSRYQCQKHKLKNILKNYNPELTEYENMSANGFFRLYDFGQSVFTWRKK